MHPLPHDWLALALVVFLLGVKHGLDPDHLATIDGLTRFNAALRPRLARWSGFLFSRSRRGGYRGCGVYRHLGQALGRAWLARIGRRVDIDSIFVLLRRRKSARRVSITQRCRVAFDRRKVPLARPLRRSEPSFIDRLSGRFVRDFFRHPEPDSVIFAHRQRHCGLDICRSAGLRVHAGHDGDGQREWIVDRAAATFCRCAGGNRITRDGFLHRELELAHRRIRAR